MSTAETECQLSMHTTLTEYAVYDASLLFGEFARECLLRVYSDAKSMPSHPHVHRALAVRLVSKGNALSSRFMWLMLRDFRAVHVENRLQELESPADSAMIARLSSSVGGQCREQLQVLAALLMHEDRSFVLQGSPFDPEHYARNLVLTLRMQEFGEEEREIMLAGWGRDAFARTMVRSYDRYIKVLNGWNTVTLPTHQDFVDTWPMQAVAGR